MAELGIIAATGMPSIAKLVAVLRDDQERRLPAPAQAALLEMAEHIESLTTRIDVLDTKIVAAVKADDAARRLTTIPGVGPIIAATVRATVQDPAAFRTGRDLAAWIGITPRAHSSGGKERLGKISKQGNKQLRTLLIVGATSILKQARRGVKLPAWVVSIMARRPYKVAAVALANKMARTIWALLVKGGIYRSPTTPATA
jgi:transposase